MTRLFSLSLVVTLILCSVPKFVAFALPTTQQSVTPHTESSTSDNSRKGCSAESLSMTLGENVPEPSGGKESAGARNSNDSVGKLEELKQREATLARLLASVREEKLSALRSRPLTIGIVGFGRFGQFIARTFAKYGRVVVTSRSDYTDIADDMGAKYIPLSDPASFLAESLDVIVLAVSIVSFEDTVRNLAPHLAADLSSRSDGMLPGPLIVDVLSVKEHPRQILLDLLPPNCDILCSHPMFGPDSGKNGWHGLNFVYERTRIDGVVLDPSHERSFHQLTEADEDGDNEKASSFVDVSGGVHSLHEKSNAHLEGMDRMERFLSIWEEEGCRMVALSCRAHDEYAANSQFITHLMGRILGEQGLKSTPIDTKGFESVLKLVGGTTADSFDLFYGLYKYNHNSMDTIVKLKSAMENVVESLKQMEKQDPAAPASGGGVSPPGSSSNYLGSLNR